jgi:hypothetical protein
MLSGGESDRLFAGNSFVVYHPTADGQTHRCTLKFNTQGASMDLFDGLNIPASGTLKTKRMGRRGGTSISEFSAKGEIPHGKGTLAFTAAKDGEGAKGTVTLTIPGKDPVTVMFSGTAPAKK